MASISLTLHEAEEGDLPNVCMRCEAPATVRKRYRFVSHPGWVYLLLPFGYLPYVIVAAIMTQRVRFYTQFCARHKNHWRIRAFIVWGAFLALVAILFGGFLLISWLERNKTTDYGSFFGYFCIGWLVLIFCWMISIPIVQLTSIHPADVTERRLTLKRVSPAFVDAVRDYRVLPTADDHRDARNNSRVGRTEPR